MSTISKIIREIKRPFKRLFGKSKQRCGVNLFSVKIDGDVFKQIVEKHKGQPWYVHAHEGFSWRLFATQPLEWINQNIPKDASILETGAGAGTLLYWLAEQGFRRLDAFDFASEAVAIANEVIRLQNYPIAYWQDNGLAPQNLKKDAYSVIYSIDWCYLREVPDYDFAAFLKTYHAALKEGGVFILELVDESFNQVDWNKYSSQDRDKPENERRPSEYKLRFSTSQMNDLAKQTGFRIANVIDRTADHVPRKIYCLLKHTSKSKSDYLFRNDDVSWDTPLAEFKKFCGVFHKHGFTQVHAVNLFGRTRCRFKYNDIPCEYENVPNISFCDNYTIRQHARSECFAERADLIGYLNSIPDEIALHGLYHVHHSQMTYEQQCRDFEDGLRILKELFPQKTVRYFVAPFNEVNADTFRAAEKFGLTVLEKQNGIHLEEAVAYVDLLPNIWYRYHHHRFYPDATYTYAAHLTVAALDDVFSRWSRQCQE